MTFSELMRSEFGYEKTTFWEDFSIAEHFGTDAIRDTFNRAFSEWKDNIVYLTELVLVLNHKIWYWYEKDKRIASIYNSLWEKADGWTCENLKSEDAEYYYRCWIN